MSVPTMQKLGFEIVGQRHEPALEEGVVSQRLGHHGEAVKRAWEGAYAHITNSEAATLFTMRLSL